jgi:chitin disaccharide deacetylase
VTRRLIINADDLGASEGINRAIADCHRAGTVTSASLMAVGEAAPHAAALARELPGLSIGLHWVGERIDQDTPSANETGDQIDVGPSALDIHDERAVARELARQLTLFEELVGRPPPHLDSHHHVHLDGRLMPVFTAAAAPLGIPARGDGSVRFIGGFYGQWEWEVTELAHVSVEALEGILREEVLDGWTEIACHPGYVTPQLRSIYRDEREAELRTLTDARIPLAIAELGITLSSYADWSRHSRPESA